MILRGACPHLTSADRNLAFHDTQGEALIHRAAVCRLSAEGGIPNQRRQLRVSTACSE